MKHAVTILLMIELKRPPADILTWFERPVSIPLMPHSFNCKNYQKLCFAKLIPSAKKYHLIVEIYLLKPKFDYPARQTE